MKKRLLTMLLALLMIMSVLPFAAMADEEACTHSSGTYLEQEESDCLYEGAIYYFCKDCDKLVWIIEKELAPHTYKDSKCTVCGAVCSKHSYGPEVRVEATCEENGSVTKTCTECGYKKTVKTLKAKGHDFEISVPGLMATCTVDGFTPHKECKICGEPDDDYEVIEAKGHKIITEADVAATCTEDGVFTQKCENCEYVNTQIREATGHNFVNVAAKAPTCGEAGYTAYKECTYCGKLKSKKVLAATGNHTYVNGQCACGAVASDYSGSSEPSDPNCGHASKSTYYTSSNCTQAGYKVVICDKCNTELSRDITPATGHTVTTIRREPTCTESGFVKQICEVCNVQIDYEVVSHLGHSYVNGICRTCGSADSSRYTSDIQDVFLVGRD